MGTEPTNTETQTPAADAGAGVKKPGNSGGYKGQNYNANYNRNNQNSIPKKERFTGQHPDLTGFIFTAATTRSAQIYNFTKTDERIKTHVGSNFKPAVLQSLEEMKITLPPEPTAVTAADGTIKSDEEIKFRTKYSMWLKATSDIEEQMVQVYAIYFGQCDDDMKSVLSENPNYDRVHKKKDLLGLYKILQAANYSYTTNEEPIVSMWTMKRDFIGLRQYKGQSVHHYYEKFLSLADVNESLGNNIHDDLGFEAIIAKEKGLDLSTMDAATKAQFGTDAMEEGSERMKALHLLMGADSDLYGGLVQELRRNYLMNQKNDYPKTLQAAYTLLKGWNNGKSTSKNNNRVGVAFNQNGVDENGVALVTKGAPYDGPPCTRCGREGHPTEKCFAKKREDGTLLHVEGTDMTGEVSTDILFGDSNNNAHALLFNNQQQQLDETECFFMNDSRVLDPP